VRFTESDDYPESVETAFFKQYKMGRNSGPFCIGKNIMGLEARTKGNGVALCARPGFCIDRSRAAWSASGESRYAKTSPNISVHV
jgi:hypothetical protein